MLNAHCSCSASFHKSSNYPISNISHFFHICPKLTITIIDFESNYNREVGIWFKCQAFISHLPQIQITFSAKPHIYSVFNTN